MTDGLIRVGSYAGMADLTRNLKDAATGIRDTVAAEVNETVATVDNFWDSTGQAAIQRVQQLKVQGDTSATTADGQGHAVAGATQGYQDCQAQCSAMLA